MHERSRQARQILFLILIFLACPALSDNPKPQDADADLGAADQAFRAGKFADAEAAYRVILQKNSSLIAAQVGLVRSMLRLQKIDESFTAVNDYLTTNPNSADLLAVKGDVAFRLAEMGDAQTSYINSLKIDPRQVRAYLGLARLYISFSLYRKAYDELQAARSIAPNDIELQRALLHMLSRKERIEALEKYLSGDHPDDEEETQSMREYLEFLKAVADKPPHTCKLTSKVERSETNLIVVRGEDGRRIQGIGLPVKLNDHQFHLLLDTGAGGLVVGRKVAEKAGLIPISAIHYGGIGDKGRQSGYRAVVDKIQIGELEFQDCVVSVSEKAALATEDGLIGADVFGSYIVDIDLPGMHLKLSPLPKRPEDAVAPKALNSEGEEQVNAERKEDPATNTPSDQQAPASPAPQPVARLPKDRYIAPEMTNWSKVFRFGHQILVPTWINDSKTQVLFGLDTGASINLLSLRAARQLGKVSSESQIRVRGLSGDVKNVYSARADLRFGHLHQPNQDIVTFDLASISRQIGTEVSGFLGFSMLRILEVKIDYRDGLVDFEYDPNRSPNLMMH
jgi:tetratricopeptide (TPR) repeat protein